MSVDYPANGSFDSFVNQLFLSISNGKVEATQNLLDVDRNLNHPSESFVQRCTASGETVIQLAVIKNQVKILEILLDYRPSLVYALDEEKNTALHYAAKLGNLLVMEYLYLRGAPVNYADMYGFTPLHWAAYNGHTLAVQFFLKIQNLDISKSDNENCSPFHWACIRGRDEVVDSFISGAKNLNFIFRLDTLENQNAIQLASNNSHSYLVWSLGLSVWDTSRLSNRIKKIIGFNLVPDTVVVPSTFRHVFSNLLVLSILCNVILAFFGLPEGEFVFWSTLSLLGLLSFCLYRVKSLHSHLPITKAYHVDLDFQYDQHPTEEGLHRVISHRRSIMDPLYLQFLESLPDKIAKNFAWYKVKDVCFVCGLFRGAATKHCRQTGGCVDLFDHYCPWVDCAISAGNLRAFSQLLQVTSLVSLYTVYAYTIHIYLPILKGMADGTPNAFFEILKFIGLAIMILLNFFWFLFSTLMSCRQLGLIASQRTEYLIADDESVMKMLYKTPFSEIFHRIYRAFISNKFVVEYDVVSI